MSTLSLQRTYQELRWVDDMDPMAAETDSDLESLEQDVMHVLDEILASNLADPNKGVGAVQYLSGSLANFEQMPRIIDSQLADMTRVTGSHTTLSQRDDGSFLVQIAVTVGTDIVNLQFSIGPNGLSRA